MLTPSDIDRFRALYERLFDEPISQEKAELEAQMALDLMRIIRDEALRETE